MDWQRNPFFLRALELARMSEGFTAPNPPVGAVVAKRGKIIGEGRHLCAGFPHAEVEAIDACTANPRGADLYVTLEPCCTHGRTPPCTDLIIRAGIKRVIIGCSDPNPRHAKKGFDILHKAGIETILVNCAECENLIAPFAKRITTGLPYVTLKLAMTLDGRIADRKGESKWITSEGAREEVQNLRRRADAIMVGAGTVRADDPSLLPRPLTKIPKRIILGKIPARSKVLTDAHASETIVISKKQPLRRTLEGLADKGVTHILCEGGGKLAGSLIDAGLVDEYVFFYAPLLFNDAKAVGGMTGKGFLLKNKPRLRIVEVRQLPPDVLIRAVCTKD